MTALTAMPDIAAHTESMVRPSGAIDVLFRPLEGSCTSPQAALEVLDRSGIAVAFISPCRQWSCERQWMCVDSSLEDVLRFVAASARFVGLAGYNPFDIGASLREIEEAARWGFRGVYLRPESFSLAPTDARLYPLFGKAAEVGLPVVLEPGATELAPLLERITADFPDLGLAVAPALEHTSGDDAEMCSAQADLAALLERHENLHFVLDSSALAALNRGHRELLDDPAFVSRCMWATNGAEPISALNGVAALQLAPPLLQHLLRDTANRFFSAPRASHASNSAMEETAVAER